MTTLAWTVLDMQFSLGFPRQTPSLPSPKDGGEGREGVVQIAPRAHIPMYVLCQSYARNANRVTRKRSKSARCGDLLVQPHGEPFKSRNNVSQRAFPL